METYTIKKISGEPDWSAIPPLPISHLQWTPPTDIRAEARLCWEEEALHVYLRAWERDIRAEYRGRPYMVCEDSCLEFFLRPEEADLRYFNFEFNLNAALFLGFGASMPDLVRLLVTDEQAMFRPAARRLADGWEISYRVPFAFIRRFFPGYAPHSGFAFRGNCYKCGDLTAQQHFLSWNPIQSETPLFHRPEDFGRFVLE